MTVSDHTVAVVGCGLVGRSWIIAFARAGFTVNAYDHEPEALVAAVAEIRQALDNLAQLDLLNGHTADQLLKQVRCCDRLDQAVTGSIYIQENTSESIAVKQSVFEQIDCKAPASAIIASSTSALLPSQFTAGLDHPERCLVAHPLNPPHLIPAVEIVPSAQTSDEAVQVTMNILGLADQRPILVRRETEGFLMNRLQGALLDEAFAIVEDGIATPNDVDIAVKDGLARRWSFMGPFETIDLNAPNGVRDFIDRYGAAYDNIGKHRSSRHSWNDKLTDDITRARRDLLPADQIRARQDWRDRRLASLAAYIERASKELGE